MHFAEKIHAAVLACCQARLPMESGFRAKTLAPWTPYRLAVFSFVVLLKQSKRSNT
jgi:hypothetical protein